MADPTVKYNWEKRALNESDTETTELKFQKLSSVTKYISDTDQRSEWNVYRNNNATTWPKTDMKTQ
jgi:hypothetical protein